MKNINEIISAIDSTIAARKEQLPAIGEERSRVAGRLVGLNALQHQLEELYSAGPDEQAVEEIDGAKALIGGMVSELEGYQAALDELEAEFKRDTLNIGVSGAARTGKSTTLQHITGLTDKQIPSGGLNPVTAVRSEIFNSPRNEAVITFKTEQVFIEGYVRPHVANVNEYLKEKSRLAIGSLAALRNAKFPEKLEGSVSAAATDSLKRLREAQRSIDTYSLYLGANPYTVRLDDVRSFVTYPSPDKEQIEAQGGPAADRRYLAVELAQVYCQFPNLGAAKVGLVDLPGLGEIGNSASDVHLKGLEDKVDQIFLVMKPSKEKAFTDAEVGHNLDQLQTIQPAVKRGDLIVAGINKDAAVGQEAANNLRSHFETEINAGRSDTYSVIEYCAVDDGDVARMFGELLDRLGSLLPEMDRQKVEHCMGSMDLTFRIESTAEQIIRIMDRILRAIPSSNRVMKERIDAIERSIIGKLDEYAVELSKASKSDSEAYKEFVADAQRIHDDVKDRIDNGLLYSDEDKWLDYASSSKDYYNLYRDECKRIRYEIIDAYCGLDRFYGVYVSNFKMRVLDTLLRSCGMDSFFGFGASDSADERISKVSSELGSTLHDDDLESALRLLSGVRFDFRSNVFLQIEEHLAELANPEETFYSSSWENKREILGGSGSSEDKRKNLAKYLRYDACKANDAILEALKNEGDHFNKYLAVSIDFFNNYLFGKDEDNFKQVVIRGLIQSYKQWVLPDADDASKSPLGQKAREVKESAKELKAGKMPAMRKTEVAEKMSKLSVGKVYKGKIIRAEETFALVSVNGETGIIPGGEVKAAYVNDVREHVKKGSSVNVKLIKIEPEKDSLVFSMKKCPQK